MDTRTEKAFQSVIMKLPAYRDLESTPERHIYLLWLITKGVTLLGGERPILVGGGAIEFYTGIRFATGDLDLVAPDKEICEGALKSLGYERPSELRHFVNRSISSLVEIHSTCLRADEEAVELVYRKVPLLLIGPEDCITDRLDKYSKHGSTLDLLNAFLVSYHQRDRIDISRLSHRLDSLDLWDFYRPIQDINRALVCSEIGADEAAASLIQFMKKGTRKCAF